MIVLIVCVVLVAVALIVLGVLVFGLLGQLNALGRQVTRAQATLAEVDAVLGELSRSNSPSGS